MRQRHDEVLPEILSLDGARVVDVGCGDGGIARLMAKHGAHVTGVEPNPAQVAKARAADKVADETFIEGVAQNLPMGDGEADIVVFFNSLHHIPADVMDAALREAARVVKPGGTVLIAEPVANGPHFELMQPVHDETEVRAQAQDAIRRADGACLAEERAFVYIHPVVIRDFAAFRDRMLRINPHKSADFESMEPELIARFERIGVELDDGGREFDQPMQVSILHPHSA